MKKVYFLAVALFVFTMGGTISAQTNSGPAKKNVTIKVDTRIDNMGY
ncbi:MAG: hypothetical protein JW731_02105 [Bacteroidales bacterium]|nr:hypothetical protein [Bacteroidales bacterium]